MYEAKWRRAGRQVKRRVGPAWLERAPTVGWGPRRGRLPEGCFDEKRATVRMAELVAEHDRPERAIEEGSASAASGARPSARSLGVARAAGARAGREAVDAEDYGYMLAEPGTPHRRGTGRARAWSWPRSVTSGSRR